MPRMWWCAFESAHDKTYVGDQDEQHFYLERVDRQAQELLGLVERVLTFNDVTRQDDRGLDLSPVNLAETFEPIFHITGTVPSSALSP